MEFHAIILCGGGHRLAPFSTFTNTSSGTSKALLPVANKPLIQHAIEWCEKVSFKNITVVTTASTQQEIKRYIDETSFPQSIEVVGRDSHDTGEIVASLTSSINGDFVVLPCDFITDVDPRVLINAFRNRDKDVLISGIYYKNNLEHVDKKALQADVLIHTPLQQHQPKVLDIFTKDSVTDRKYLDLRMAMLWRYPNAVASTKILSSGIFFCSHNVLDILLDTISKNSVSPENKIWSKVVRDFARRSWRHRTLLETVSAYILPDDVTFMRANNLSVYLEANRYIMRQKMRNAAPKQPGPAPKGGATISPDSIVDPQTVIEEKSTIKKSAIGKSCKIGKKCRITGCVIFDGVTIADDVYLENCLIGKGAVIEARSRLTSCNVEGKYVVTSGSQFKNEILQSLGIEEEYIYDDSVLKSDSDDGATSEGSRWAEDEDEEDDDDNSEDDGLFDRS